MAEKNFIPFKRQGTERFSKHTPSYVRFFEEFSPVVLEAIATVSSSSGQSFVIADYGSADGLTSRHLIRDCIRYIRKTYGTSIPVTVIYEDQPINDFTAVFKLNAGLIPGEMGFTEEFQNVYVLATGTSFYQQCQPPDTIDFLISSIAQHWLSKPICRSDFTEQTMFSNLASGTMRRAYEEQAARDWENFLLIRARELKTGGCIVVITPEQEKCEGVLSPMTDTWRNLQQDGIITNEEFHHTSFHFHISSKESLAMPFLDKNSPVCKAGLVLVSHITREFPSLFCPSDVEDTADVKEQAIMFVKEVKAWSENTFWSSLGNDRTEVEKEVILNEYYSRLTQALCKGSSRKYYVIQCLVIGKL